MDIANTNISTKINGNKLIIEVDLSKKLGLSSTGKSNLVANSKGFLSIPDAPAGFKLSMNVTSPLNTAA